MMELKHFDQTLEPTTQNLDLPYQPARAKNRTWNEARCQTVNVNDVMSSVTTSGKFTNSMRIGIGQVLD